MKFLEIDPSARANIGPTKAEPHSDSKRQSLGIYYSFRFAMRIKLKAENALEWLALKLNLAPRPLIETQMSFTAARAIMAAAELGLFEAIGTQAQTADEVAKTCQTHPLSTKHLLDCLVGIGYLTWSGGNYSLKRVH